MKYVIKRTGYTTKPAYLTGNGWFDTYDIKNARSFGTKEDAEHYLESEKDDPKYDKPYMEGVTFEIVEIVE